MFTDDENTDIYVLWTENDLTASYQSLLSYVVLLCTAVAGLQ